MLSTICSWSFVTDMSRKLKAYRFSIILVWACSVYCAGFVVREISSFNQTSLGLYIASIVLLYCGPLVPLIYSSSAQLTASSPIYAAVNYLVLGRALHYIPYLSPIHPGRVVTTFIGLDTLVEVLTANGASRIARYNDPDSVRLGSNLLRASLILQLVLYLAFLALQQTFYRRCVRAGVATRRLRTLMWTMAVSVSLILMRSIYRVVDSYLGDNGYIESHEWCMYAFDATPLIINSMMLNAIHPALFLPHSDKVFLCQDGKTERRGPGYKDNRPVVLTILDPFDIVGVVTKRDRKDRYWDQEDQHPLAGPSDRRFAELEGSRARPVWHYIVDPFNNSVTAFSHADQEASIERK